jgi:hypothetical protein
MFYRDERDLLDVVPPFIRAGLEDGEYCLWVTGPPVSNQDAIQTLTVILPTTQQYVQQGQLEIVPYASWYLRAGEFDYQLVTQRWLARTHYVERMEFAGMRITGSPVWLATPEQWAQFGKFELKVHESMGNEHVIALCTYRATQCDEDNMAQVYKTHGHTLHRTTSRTWTLTTFAT